MRYSPPEILQFYKFAILAGKCLTTSPFGGFVGCEPLNIVDRHPNSQKAHPWVTTRHLNHHTRTVVRECCKGDSASQWRNPKFDPPPTLKPHKRQL